MTPVNLVVDLFKILRSAASPGQIAGGFILGMIIGLTPLFSLHNLLVLLLIIILNVNIGMAIFSFTLFSLFSFLLDPLFHNFGFYILVEITSLRSLYIDMYNVPVLALSKFNNTVVMGSFVTSLILLIPMYFFMKRFVVIYREKLDPKIEQLKIVKALKATKLYQLFDKAGRLINR